MGLETHGGLVLGLREGVGKEPQGLPGFWRAQLGQWWKHPQR